MSGLRILVPIKRVIDYAVKPRVNRSQTSVEVAGVKHSMNPFDELAVHEAALMRKEKRHPQGVEDICVISAGGDKASDVLLTGLAMGADRAIHVHTGPSPAADAIDAQPEPLSIAKMLARAAKDHGSNLVVLGKQAIDDDSGQTGAMLAGLLGWGQASQAAKISFKDAETVEVTREVDGGVETVRGKLPMVITTDLRLNDGAIPNLPSIMKAKKKPMEKKKAQDYDMLTERRVKLVKVAEPPPRQGGGKVEDVDGLISKLKSLGALP